MYGLFVLWCGCFVRACLSMCLCGLSLSYCVLSHGLDLCVCFVFVCVFMFKCVLCELCYVMVCVSRVCCCFVK